MGIEAAGCGRGSWTRGPSSTPRTAPACVRSIQISARDLAPWNEVFRVDTRFGIRWFRGEAMPVREADGATVWNGIFLDVSDQKAVQEQLERLNRDLDRRLLDLRQAESDLQRLARYDSLTGLSNRSFFLETLSQVLLRAERRKNAGRPRLHRPRRLQGRQRQPRPRGGRPAPAHRGRSDPQVHAAHRHACARIGGDEFTVLVQDLERGDDAALAAQAILDELVRSPARSPIARCR